MTDAEWMEHAPQSNEELRSRTIQEYVDEMYQDSVRWFGEPMLITLVLGLNGEAGEVADELKKCLRGSKQWEQAKEKMIVEVIDVFHYWCLIVGLLQIDVESVYTKKREYNLARYERAPSDGA